MKQLAGNVCKAGGVRSGWGFFLIRKVGSPVLNLTVLVLINGL